CTHYIPGACPSGGPDELAVASTVAPARSSASNCPVTPTAAEGMTHIVPSSPANLVAGVYPDRSGNRCCSDGQIATSALAASLQSGGYHRQKGCGHPASAGDSEQDARPPHRA